MKLKITAEENFSAVYPRSTSPRKVHESFHHIHPINSLCSMHPWKKELKATPVLQFYRALPSNLNRRGKMPNTHSLLSTHPLNKTICNPHDRSNRQKGQLPNTKPSFSETKKTKTPRNSLDWKDFFFLPCNTWQCSVLSWERQGAQRKERNLNLLKVRHDLSLSFSVREGTHLVISLLQQGKPQMHASDMWQLVNTGNKGYLDLEFRNQRKSDHWILLTIY